MATHAGSRGCLEDRSASAGFLGAPETRANAVASVFKADNIAYIEDADFLKLREIAVTYYAPATWAQRLGANSLSFTVSGRNLGTWTKYTGFDPELSQIGQSNFSQRDFLTQPPVRYFTARVNVTL